MEKIRLFIAANIDNLETKKSLLSLQSQFKFRGVKLVKEYQFHFTFHFLGDTDINKVSDITGAMDGISKEKFSISLQKCGYFPSNRGPRVIWVGVSNGKADLIQIQQFLINPLKELDFLLDRREYNPHLTIARIKHLDPKHKIKIKDLISQNKNIEIGTSLINEIQLIKSELTPQGSVYTNLYTKELL